MTIGGYSDGRGLQSAHSSRREGDGDRHGEERVQQIAGVAQPVWYLFSGQPEDDSRSSTCTSWLQSP